MKLKDVLKVNIGGKEFEIVKNDYFDEVKKRVSNSCGTTLDHCYDRYSKYKKNIYNNWLKWHIYNNCFDFGISSYNCMMFTLTMSCGDIACDNYLYITPTHNNFVVNSETWKGLKNIVYELKKEFNSILRQRDTKQVWNTFDPYYTFKMCIENEIPSLLAIYEPRFKNILGINSNIAFNVMNTLCNEYVI